MENDRSLFWSRYPASGTAKGGKYWAVPNNYRGFAPAPPPPFEKGGPKLDIYINNRFSFGS